MDETTIKTSSSSSKKEKKAASAEASSSDKETAKDEEEEVTSSSKSSSKKSGKTTEQVTALSTGKVSYHHYIYNQPTNINTTSVPPLNVSTPFDSLSSFPPPFVIVMS